MREDVKMSQADIDIGDVEGGYGRILYWWLCIMLKCLKRVLRMVTAANSSFHIQRWKENKLRIRMTL
jgi:hypothetical protein